MRIPLLLAGILVWALTGVAILCVPDGQAIRIVLPALGEAKPAAGTLLGTVWLVSALAAVAATTDVLRSAPDQRPSPMPLHLRLQPDGDLGIWIRTPLRECLVAVAVTAIVLVAVLAGQLALPRGLALAALVSGAIIAGLQLTESLTHDPVEIRSHWGGLGAGLGGWRISRSAILLVLTLALAAAAVATVVAAPPPAKPAPVPPSVTR